MLAWLAPVLVLGLVVFVHELGHFLAAKITGVYAPRFSLGWGKALLRWRPRGTETEYVISALPIGGYVRMASRADETASILEGGNEQVKEGAERDPRWDPNALVPHGPKPVPPDRWFESKPTVARVFILLAGVTMNVVLTLVIATSVFAVYGHRYVPAVIDTVVAGHPAAKVGFQKGDSVVAVDGTPVRSWNELLRTISGSPGRQLRVEVVRGGARTAISVAPEAEDVPNELTGKTERLGRIGMGAVQRTVSERISTGAAIANGWRATLQMGGSVIGVLAGLLRGTVSVKTLGGPIAIARVSVTAAQTGLEPLFTLIAFLSVNLAVLNLLPIPILDGGQVLITIAEGLKGKPFTDRTRENMMKVGLALIAALFMLVMFNDIKALVLSIFG
ncbi:MAG TPA: RIP metalloprotease RseP [Gemmatimonadaceae bacterium]|nr:RIP metalloprotease RseP [Gemmatimonadaceae bacterium]